LKLEWVRELAIHRTIPGVSPAPAAAVGGAAPALAEMRSRIQKIRVASGFNPWLKRIYNNEQNDIGN
jgi:hypothetical protein